jgi:hypothetical protein
MKKLIALWNRPWKKPSPVNGMAACPKDLVTFLGGTKRRKSL